MYSSTTTSARPNQVSAYCSELFGGVGRLELALREWIGLTTYWILGRTNVYFPGPQATPDN